MVLVRRVPLRLALVPVPRVFPVQMAVVRVVDVVAVGHLRVTAAGGVCVLVQGVFLVEGRHGAEISANPPHIGVISTVARRRLIIRPSDQVITVMANTASATVHSTAPRATRGASTGGR
ncbi:hypothetical protein GCM10010347_37130 [Streptomyces cirratus]|uniref:Secreted protein n=1 Tax=Streptomyces cirratus TaxID=68187 RepID=A0ABQ3F1G3_9ACTN|nr:hypothetical protein GCM10010347_37130 [Streptomyces cirratus]